MRADEVAHTVSEHPDLRRLRSEYARRLDECGRYSLFNAGHLFAAQSRQRAVLRSLRRSGLYPLDKRRILEVGPGTGGILLETLSYGAEAAGLFGADLLFDRVHAAHQRLATLPLTCADGQRLPYPAHTFDLSMQFTVFSSILSDDVRWNMAQELVRVTRRSGTIIWYDFWLNPTNEQTRGIRPAEIRHLFPNCRLEFERITLAPPIARRLTPVSWGLSWALETLKVFNTHYLATIHPCGDQQ